jgi:hypothetical protein
VDGSELPTQQLDLIEKRRASMNDQRLTDELAWRVLGWRVAPGRFMMRGRGWKPDWRFQPTKKLADAFQLLDAADTEEYSISARRGDALTVRVQIGGIVGEASDTSRARAITYAVARAVGLEPEGRPAKARVGR